MTLCDFINFFEIRKSHYQQNISKRIRLRPGYFHNSFTKINNKDKDIN